MKENWRKRLQQLSQTSINILYKFKEVLIKHKTSLKKHLQTSMKPSEWDIIDRDDLTTIIESCNIYPRPEQINQLYNNLMYRKTRLIKFDHLQQIINNISKGNHLQIKKRVGQNQFFEQLRKDNNIVEIIEIIRTIGGQSGDILTSNNSSCKNQQNKQIFIKNILDGSQTIRVQDFIEKIGFNIQEIRCPLQKQFQIQHKKEDVRKIEIYFNSPTKNDENLINISKIYLITHKIFKDENNPTSKKAIDWVHLSEDKIGYQLFSKIQQNSQSNEFKNFFKANHIIQGKLNDCYLLSAMAVLVETFPLLIYRLFVIFQNPSHIYGVRLFIEGHWQTIPLDIQFPIHKNRNYCGARSQNQKIWGMLLEKAYAKVNNSYENIEGGTNQQGIEVISGAPSYSYDISKPIYWNRNIKVQIQDRQIDLSQNMIEWQQVFSKIIEVQCYSKSILTCSCKDTTAEQKLFLKNLGLQAHHSYSILKVFPNKRGSDDRQVTLIKLRNPWGRKVPQDHQWNLFGQLWTNTLRKQLGYKVNPHDGSFFMCKEDFIKYFARVNICRINPNYKNSSFDLNFCNSKFTSVRIFIKKKGRYTFTTYLKDRKKITKKYKNGKLQRFSWMFLLRKQGGKFKRVCCNYFQTGNNMTEHSDELEEGEYVLMSKIRWSHKDQQHYCLASYGPEQVTMEPMLCEDRYLQDYIEIDSQKAQRLHFKNNQNKDTFIKMKFYPLFGYGFIQIENIEKQIFNVKIQFGKKTYVYIIGPEKKRPIHLHVNSGQKVSRKFIVKQYFNDVQIQFNYEYGNQTKNK